LIDPTPRTHSGAIDVPKYPHALQFRAASDRGRNPRFRSAVRAQADKLSGFTHPSRVNEAAFGRAFDDVAEVARRLLQSLETASPARDREIEAMKAKARAKERFA
jgi:hypothetical protein